MPKPKPPQTFDKTVYGREYGSSGTLKDKFATIYEVIHYMPRSFANAGCTIQLSGNRFKLSYESYELNLNQRIKDVRTSAKEYMNECIKYLKKEYKNRRGETLELKELKDLADETIEKAGLNSRWMFHTFRVYEWTEEDELRKTPEGNDNHTFKR